MAHTRIRHVFVALILLAAGSPVNARAQTVVAGAAAVYHLPVGTLADRFQGATGIMVYAGRQVGSDWTWIGKAEYVELNKLNTGKLLKQVNVQIGRTVRQQTFPLPRLTMNLKALSLMAEAQYSVIQAPFLETHLNFGFGFTNWKHVRGAYYDSLFADTSTTGSPRLINVATLAVPEITQMEWSGTINLGIEATFRILPPVSVTVGAEYKLMIGELWQTLALDLENVSGMQSIGIRAGLRVEL